MIALWNSLIPTLPFGLIAISKYIQSQFNELKIGLLYSYDFCENIPLLHKKHYKNIFITLLSLLCHDISDWLIHLES